MPDAPEPILPPRGEHAPAPGDPIPTHYRWCYGCGTDHPSGLHMQIVAGEGLTVHGTFTVTEQHQGAPGLAHGGLLTTALDEILGSLNWLLASPAVTGRLECRFRHPVPVGASLAIDAAIIGVQGRKVFTEATGRLPDGRVAISASGLFIQVPLEHFVQHGNPEQLRPFAAEWELNP